MSTDSALSAQGQGHAKSNTQKTEVKARVNGSVPVAIAAAAARGPPGSCMCTRLQRFTLTRYPAKGRSIAAARLLGEGDISSQYSVRNPILS
jgi:hypothetical protein